ncbi:MAG TPA: MogA/MoaB family molybdenum cofactor biosynthesis protein [candidate division Zixibacteria bacterium]|nr:MogA/MoaB family molybdenum cofactor biosynthesis protein [candidate division Zixibacteria bacterium]
MTVRVAVLTVSDRSKEGIYEDKSGPRLIEIIRMHAGWDVAEIAVVRDEVDDIKSMLSKWCAEEVNLILTTGGTGFGPRDRTPEATKSVIEKDAPGISESLRAESLKKTPYAMLSRGVSGITGHTLIINLPGNPKAISECMDILIPVLPHALELLMGTGSANHDA